MDTTNNIIELLKVTIIDLDKLSVRGVDSMAIVVNSVNRISAVIQELSKAGETATDNPEA